MYRVRTQPSPIEQPTFDVVLEKGYLRRVVSDLKMSRFAKKYIVISSKKTFGKYGRKLAAQLKREKMFLGKVIVLSDDESKSFEQLQSLMQQMVNMGGDEQSGVIALGGGVVLDLAGICAVLYARELPLVYIPTTVTAMVSSSISGVSQLHLAESRNSINHRVIPHKVFIDVEVLQTLTVKIWKGGICAMLRYALLMDRSLWEFFENNIEVFQKAPKDFLISDFVVIEDTIRRCVELRSIMFEKRNMELMGYGKQLADEIIADDRFDWGESLAVSMRLMGDLAVRLGSLRNEELVRFYRLFDELKLGQKKVKGLVIDFVKSVYGVKDKIDFILVSRIGSVKQYMGKPFTPVEKCVLKHVLLESSLIDNLSLDSGVQSSESRWQSRSYNQSFQTSSSYPKSSPHDGVISLNQRESYFNGRNLGEQKGSYSSSGQPQSLYQHYSSGGLNQSQHRQVYDGQSSSEEPTAISNRSEVFSNPLNIEQSETDLQKRLRELREKRTHKLGGGGLGAGGFLPG